MCERPANPESASNNDGRRIQTISGRGKQSIYYTDWRLTLYDCICMLRLISKRNVVFVHLG